MSTKLTSTLNYVNGVPCSPAEFIAWLDLLRNDLCTQMGEFESIARFRDPSYPEPTPEPSEPTSDSVIEAERAKETMRVHLAETRKLKENKKTAFGIIWGRLSQGSRDILDKTSIDPAALPFSTLLDNRNDPLELLRRIIATHLTIAGPNVEVRLDHLGTRHAWSHGSQRHR